MVVSLAGSFFSLDPNSARSQMLLYLIVSFAPLAAVAPLIGPLVDRAPGGRRALVQATAAVRIVLYLLMMFNYDNLLLFPLVFGVMVLQRVYGASKSAIVPTVVSRSDELVEANSKLGLLGGVSGAVAVAPAGLLALISPRLSLVFGMLALVGAAAAATALPASVVAAQPARRAERLDLRSPSVLLGASGMALIRAAQGFLFFHVLFFLRENNEGKIWLGLVAASVTAGAMTGNTIAPVLRRRIREELMLAGALAGVALGGLVAALTGGPLAAVLLALALNVASAVGRLAFESLVQRDAPGANQGRAFASFDARFQLAWVAAAVFAVLLTLPGRLGFTVVALIGAFASASYLVGSRAVRAGRPIPRPVSQRVAKIVETSGQIARPGSRARRRSAGNERPPPRRPPSGR